VARCFLIPGMGADGRMLAPQCAALPDVAVLEWIEPASEQEPIAAYAARLAATIPASPPFLLGGVSFGGIVAQEIARHVHPTGVVLIASWRARESLALHVRALAAVGPWMPTSPFRLGAHSSLVARAFGLRTATQRELFRKMFRAASPRFLHWAARVVHRWQGVQGLAIPVRQLHGAEDRIVPLARVRADVVVPEAGHLVNLTDPEPVNRFLARELL